MFGDAPRIEGKGGLADKWLIPPFSVLDAKSGVWQKRKGEWLRIFQIVSELGRGEDASPGGSARPSATLGIDGKTVGGDGAGKAFAKMTNIADWTNEQDNLSAPETGTSIFDPFLCQLMYLWFCPPGGLILDPFAGGSVRGIVAAWLGYRYIGVELRKEQIDANLSQWAYAKIVPNDGHEIHDAWIEGDSRNLKTLVAEHPDISGSAVDFLNESFDFVFTCPPYFDLEVYSDDPRDLSTMSWPDFRNAYREIIIQASGLLKPNRFACYVVGDMRDKKGFYRRFPDMTSNAFELAGLPLYHDLILANSIASASLRVAKQMVATRKMVKTHQNVLVYVKGDPAKAAALLENE